MKRLAIAVIAVGLAAAATTVTGDEPEAPPPPPAADAPPPSPEAVAEARRAFADVYKVLTSPRCRNCHPKGDRPLQTDAGRPHAMNISRLSGASGLACSACHQEHNSEAVGVAGGPPGAHHWGLPPKDVPMVFEGHTPTSLCEQLKDRARNGKRSLADLVDHVQKDPLVLWAWNPGGTRTKPPMDHKAFVAAVSRWAAGGGACPDPAP